MNKSFLVAHRTSEKTLGAVYAPSLQTAMDIAGALWAAHKDALSLFDVRQEFECAQAVKEGN